MKRVMQVGSLANLRSPKGDREQIVFGRTGKKVWIQNLEVLSRDKFSFELNEATNELIIKAKINDGEFLAIKELKGIADKEFVCGKDDY